MSKNIEPVIPPTEFFQYGQVPQVLSDSGIFFIWGEINNINIYPAVQFILEKNIQPNNLSELRLIINSPGGNLTDAMALVDIMKLSSLPIQTIGLGQIASSGLLIFMSGTRGRRSVTTNTSIMSHQFSTEMAGKEHELFAISKEIEDVKRRLISLYMAGSGLSKKNVLKYLLPPTDVWLNAKEAVELGIADRIIDTIG